MSVADVATGGRARTQASSYWPEIDGLRSIAVLAVFIYHFDHHALGSGFIGVDIFFVISGFLISTILLTDIDKDHFSIARFYQRRIARIAPAFFLVVFVTLVWGAFVYSAQDYGSLGSTSLAAALSLINMKLLFQGSYFVSSPDGQPLLHYWSLAIEEQFYLLFPLYLYVLMRFSRRPLILTIGIGLLSFVACVVLTRVNSTYAFYLLPTRAWELLAGFSVALIRRSRGGAGIAQRPASIAGWSGLALLGLSFLIIQDGGNFPGWIAALPVMGTALLLAATGNGAWLPNRLLSHPVPVFVGKRSYSLYLWHWPVFSFVDYQLYASGSALRIALKLGISIVATLLTYRLVERPMRIYLNASQHRALAFGGFAVTAIAVCVLGWAIRADQYPDADPAQITAGGNSFAGHGKETVVLFGDSQGSMYGRDLAALSRAEGFSLNILSAAGRNELPGEDATFWPQVKQFLALHRPNVVILAYAWSDKVGSDTRDVRAAMAYFKTLGVRVILMCQPPILPLLATREAMRAGARPPFFEAPADRANRLRTSASIRSLSDDRTTVLDPAAIFLGKGQAINLIGNNGRFTYQDARHLSDTGTALVRPMIDRALAAAIAAP